MKYGCRMFIVFMLLSLMWMTGCKMHDNEIGSVKEIGTAVPENPDLCPYAIQYDGVTYYYDSKDEHCVPEGQLQIYQVLGTIQTSVPGNQMPAQDFETNISGQVGLTLYRVDRAVLLLNDTEHGAWYYTPELVQYNGAYYWGAKTVCLSQEDLPAECSLIGPIQSTVSSDTCPTQDMESNRSGDQGRSLYRVNDHILLRHDVGRLYTCFYLYE